MSDRAVITQSDLTALNRGLEKIAANLKLHVNSSLSTAHGINARMGGYYDTAGDKWGSIVLIFEFGTPPSVTRFHVPAQVTSLGPSSTGSGMVNVSGVPAGTFTSPGVPLTSKSLITEATVDSLGLADIYNSLLTAHTATVHADTGANQCHGGRTYTAHNVIDSLGHVVGRHYITIGVNGKAYAIPADTYISPAQEYGPPQLIRGVNLLANIPLKHNAAKMGRENTQYGGFWLTPPTGGTLPITGIEWQINSAPDGTGGWNVAGNVATDWHDINVAGRDIRYDISNGNPPGTESILIASRTGSDDKKLQCTIRAKITNIAGSVYTNYARFYANDEEGCSFAGIDFSSPNTNQKTWFEIIPDSPPIQ